MQTPFPKRPPSILRYTLLSAFVLYLVYGILQTALVYSSMVALLKTPMLALAQAMIEGASPEQITAAMEIFVQKFITSEPYLLLLLFSEMAFIGLFIFYCKKVEKLPLGMVGMLRKKAVLDYAVGILGGAVMLSGAVFICQKAGAVTISFQKNANILYVVLFFFAFLVQGFAEEILYRGYIFRRLCLGHSVFTSALISAGIFAFMHVGNVSMSFLAFFNIFLFGIFAALLVYRCDGGIWCAAALHSVWNFAQGAVFGSAVSGNIHISSLFLMQLGVGRGLTHGGAFGLEGGAAVTLVLLVATAIVWILPQRNAPKKEKQK